MRTRLAVLCCVLISIPAFAKSPWEIYLEQLRLSVERSNHGLLTRAIDEIDDGFANDRAAMTTQLLAALDGEEDHVILGRMALAIAAQGAPRPRLAPNFSAALASFGESVHSTKVLWMAGAMLQYYGSPGRPNFPTSVRDALIRVLLKQLSGYYRLSRVVVRGEDAAVERDVSGSINEALGWEVPDSLGLKGLMGNKVTLRNAIRMSAVYECSPWDLSRVLESYLANVDAAAEQYQRENIQGLPQRFKLVDQIFAGMVTNRLGEMAQDRALAEDLLHAGSPERLRAWVTLEVAKSLGHIRPPDRGYRGATGLLASIQSAPCGDLTFLTQLKHGMWSHLFFPPIP